MASASRVTVVARCNTQGGILAVVGNLASLGKWDASNAAKMKLVPEDPSNQCFTLDIEAPLGSRIQYKYVLIQEHRFVTERTDAATIDDGLLPLSDGGVYEYGYLQRAAQLRVYIKKDGGNGPVSSVHLIGKKLEDFAVNVLADSPGHRHPIEADGVWAFHLSDQSPLSFRVDFLAAGTGDLIGRTCIAHSELVDKRGTLSRPIIGTSLAAVGELTVSYLIITPFVHPKNTVEALLRPFPGVPGTKFIGHRGFGSTNNLLITKHRRKYGIATENTLSSFLTAAKHGAQWVEFDVQLTKDNIPVLVHDEDINVATLGADGSPVQVRVPVNKLNLEKLRRLRAVMPATAAPQTTPNRRRRKSLTDIRDDSGSESDGSSISSTPSWERSLWARLDGYPTLAEMFQHVPSKVGFNVEIKWPDEDITVAQYGLSERNFYVDTILNCIFQHAGDRPLILSSFDPSICLLARHKQLRYPVYFLTSSGWEKMTDERKATLEASIAFAQRANLHGVVSESHAIVANPLLIRLAHDAGLTLLSYGALNNVAEHVALQVENGIDAIITDEMDAIRAELKRAPGKVVTEMGSATSIATQKAVPVTV